MIIKYSIGGSITSVADKDGIEVREENTKEIDGKRASCDKCGLQYVIKDGDSVRCCGKRVALN